MDKNIYTILDDIEFENKVKNICKIYKIEDTWLMEQKIFSIIQKFYDVLQEDSK